MFVELVFGKPEPVTVMGVPGMPEVGLNVTVGIFITSNVAETVVVLLV